MPTSFLMRLLRLLLEADALRRATQTSKSTYERTALSDEADAHVHHLAEEDRKAGPEWESRDQSAT